MKMYRFHYGYPDGQGDYNFVFEDRNSAVKCLLKHLEYSIERGISSPEGIEEIQVEIPNPPCVGGMTPQQAYTYGRHREILLACPICHRKTYKIIDDGASGLNVGICKCGFHHAYT